MLHAGGSSGRQWVKSAAILQSRFRVVAPDLWGFGQTDAWQGEASLSHDHQAELVAQVMRQLKIGRP
jgi:pimeloyl-ACP methyl ester carboxylesterase